MPGLGLMLIGVIGIQISDAKGVLPEDAVAFARALGTAIEARTGERVALDDPAWPRCAQADRCIEAIASRTHSDQVVLLRLVHGIRLTRLIAERFRSSSSSTAASRSELNVAAEVSSADNAALFERGAKELFPEPRRAGAAIDLGALTTRGSVAESGAHRVPWLLAGGGVIAGGIGLGFGVSSASARGGLEREPPKDLADYQSRNAAMKGEARLANALIGSALVLIGGAIVWWFVE